MSRSSRTTYLTVTTLVAVTAVAVLYVVHRERRNKTQKKKLHPTGSELSTTSPLERDFQAAVKIVNNVIGGKLSQGDKLMLYGLYKQATVGNMPQNEQRPTFNLVQAAKYDAWFQYQGMSPQKAKETYTEVVAKLQNVHPNDDIVYENANEFDDYAQDGLLSSRNDVQSMQVVVSTMANNHQEEEEYLTTNGSNHDLTISTEQALRNTVALFTSSQTPRSKQLAALEAIEKTLTQGQVNVNDVDEDGQSALHFAADRGSVECLQLLIDFGANVNAADEGGISVLQAAVIAGNKKAVELLLQAGADPDQEDMDGDSARSCAQDDDEMKQLFLERK